MGEGRGVRAWGVLLVAMVKKMTTLDTTASASCDQKLIQPMRLHAHRQLALRQAWCTLDLACKKLSAVAKLHRLLQASQGHTCHKRSR